MRVAHVNLSDDLGGGECQTLILSRALAATNAVHQRLILRTGSRLLEQAAQLRGCQIRPVANSFVAAARATDDCDVIHIHEPSGLKAGALASLWGRPFVFTQRQLQPAKTTLLNRWCYSRAAKLIGVSNAAGNAIKTRIEDAQVETIYDGVPLPEFAVETEPVSRKREQRFIVACIGELDEATKGHRTVFAAARALRKDYPEIAFWIIGRGSDEARLRALAARLPSVRFGGWMADMSQCYRDIDLVVRPSRDEALGSVILEAMSFGIPVIGTRVGGIPEIVRPGYNGALIDVDDGQGLADEIVRRYKDPAQLARQGANARLTAERFSAAAMAQHYAALYHQVLAARHAPSPSGLMDRSL